MATRPATPQPAPKSGVGDRLEAAIEQHVDVSGEVARGTDELERGSRAGRWRRLAIRLAVAGVSLYLVAPSVVETAGSWRSLQNLSPAWLVGMVVLQGGALASLWVLQRIALRARRWRPIIASQLASNAAAKVAPGGGAVGAAVQ
jgi:hypothetical protein